ncbi:hypothetical protein [Dyadobacter pollutisoli]|uniref:PH domain-containing protein n=1 Tax=Dyadobacter pollutisoli TaxID=2910158 RepID=A0A9E8N6G6_9BACT|nr:hypothetical protein [Dyadobacter pollutisoli]WAC10729.1 hypothetical protein ON006_23670 [Dyadobacter pollutisoli]
MDTFLIFVFVFGIFAWCIWKLLNYTKNTIGKNSPLKVVRVYQIQEWQYFLKFENLFIYYLLGAGLLITKASFSIYTSEFNLFLTRLLIFSLGSVMLFACAFYLILDTNHWKYVRNIRLETDPVTHELDLHFPDHTLTIRDGDIEKVVVASNEAKLRFSYMTYFLKNGEQFILSDRMPGIEVIHEYFKKIPIEYHKERFPYIK